MRDLGEGCGEGEGRSEGIRASGYQSRAAASHSLLFFFFSRAAGRGRDDNRDRPILLPITMATLTCPPPIATAPATADGDAPPLLSPRAAGPARTLDSIIAATPRCHLTPFSFFVSWQGVLTLAYR